MLFRSGLIAIHDAPVPVGDVAILKCLNRYGSVFLRRLCALKYADLDAHARTPEVASRRQEVTAFEERMTQMAKTGCYTMRQLAVNGADQIGRASCRERVFEVYSGNNKLVGSYTTAADGTIQTDYLLPGEYTVKEIIPEGSPYTCDAPNPKAITIEAGKTAEVTDRKSVV